YYLRLSASGILVLSGAAGLVRLACLILNICRLPGSGCVSRWAIHTSKSCRFNGKRRQKHDHTGTTERPPQLTGRGTTRISCITHCETLPHPFPQWPASNFERLKQRIKR